MSTREEVWGRLRSRMQGGRGETLAAILSDWPRPLSEDEGAVRYLLDHASQWAPTRNPPDLTMLYAWSRGEHLGLLEALGGEPALVESLGQGQRDWDALASMRAESDTGYGVTLEGFEQTLTEWLFEHAQATRESHAHSVRERFRLEALCPWFGQRGLSVAQLQVWPEVCFLSCEAWESWELGELVVLLEVAWIASDELGVEVEMHSVEGDGSIQETSSWARIWEGYRGLRDVEFWRKGAHSNTPQ